MHALDWVVLVAFLGYVVFDGFRRGRKSKGAEDYFLAGRSVRWWALGLSIMATQASAITLLSTTGHGYQEGLHFLHVYLALPFAVVILCSTVVPWFMKARVYTAYEFLESRFDGKARSLATVMYLISRGLVVGPILYAPAVILSLMLGIAEWQSVLIMGVLAIAYTVAGGMAAVIFTDVKQMAVMMIGIVACLIIVIGQLPSEFSLWEALDIAGASGKLEAVVVRTDAKSILSEKYNLLSGLFGGIFLFLGYFGADQSQVQRFLSGASISQSRRGLFLLAFAKVPMQFVILLLGSLLFVHYTFVQPPVFFQETELRQVIASEDPETASQLETQYSDLQQRFGAAWSKRQEAARTLVDARGDDRALQEAAVALRRENDEVHALKQEGVQLLQSAVGEKRTDLNHIFPYFLMSELPVGLLGLNHCGRVCRRDVQRGFRA